MLHRRLGIVRLLEAFVVAVLHDARFWIGEIVLVFVTRSWLRWLRSTAPALLAGALFFLLASGHLAFIVGLFFGMALTSHRFDHRLGLGQIGQLRAAASNLVFGVKARPLGTRLGGRLFALRLLCQRKQLLDFLLQTLLHGQDTSITHRLALGRIRMDLAAIDTDVAQSHIAQDGGKYQHLHKQPLQRFQIVLAKLVVRKAGAQHHRVMVRVHVPGDITKWNRFIRRTLQLARTEGAGCIAVEQQSQQHFRRIGHPAAVAVPLVDFTQVKQRYNADDESGQVLFRQRFSQRDLNPFRCLVIRTPESPVLCHAHTLPSICQRADCRFSPTSC